MGYKVNVNIMLIALAPLLLTMAVEHDKHQLNSSNICDVPQEKGASRKIPKLFWDTCGKVAGKLWESCGKSCRDLRESCGKFDRSLREKAGKSCGELREVAGFRKSEFAR